MKIRDLLYSLMPHSMNKSFVKWKCGLRFQDEVLQSNRIAMYPHTLDIDELVSNKLERAVSFLPYCAKPKDDFECPLCDPVYGRKDSKCLKLMESECNVPCSLGAMIDVLKRHGFTPDRIFIIDNDSNLLSWLEEKKNEGYDYFFPGVACYYGVGYALDYISKKLGYSGCIVFLDDYDSYDSRNGMCRGIFDYMNMEKYDKDKRTKISDQSIKTMDMLLGGEY